MAIVFTKDISETKLLTAYNNHIVQFASDSDLTPLTCDVTGFGMDVTLYPHPDKSFYFNLKEYIAAAINTKKFEDTLEADLLSGDIDTFTYDVSDGSFIAGTVTFKINFIDTTFESTSRNLKFISGVYQLQDWKKQEINSDAEIVVMSPVKTRTNNTINIDYWEGYPFEFSIYSDAADGEFTLKNISNGLSDDFTFKGPVTSVWLSDGRTDVTIEDFVPLMIGNNAMRVLIEGEDTGTFLTINKHDADCGMYFKWLNHLGRWTYWLLHKNHFIDRNTKYSGELANDNKNLEDTFSPVIQTGKTTNDSLRCIAKDLDDDQKERLIGITESPKIYFYTGERFSRSNVNDWIEVELKTTNLRIGDTGKVKTSYNLDFGLPDRYAQFL